MPRSRALPWAGCGDDKDKDKKVEGLPEPNAPLATRIAAAETAFKTGDCKKIIPFLHSRERGTEAKPGSAPTAEECKRNAPTLKFFKSLDFGRTQESGTVANVDASDGKDKITSLWMLDTNGDWSFLSQSQLIPDAKDPDVQQVGTEPDPANKFDATAAAFAKAIADKDCNAAWRLLSPASGLVYLRQNKKALYCKEFPETYQRKDTFGSRVVATPDLEPEKLGETADYGFYALKMKDGTVYTLVTTKDPTSGYKPQELTGHAPNGVFNYFRNSEPK